MKTKKTSRKKAIRAPERYEARRGDTEEWASEPTKLAVASSGSTIFSLRLAPAELEEIRQAAVAQGTTVSDLVRSATLNSIRQGARSGTAVSAKVFTSGALRVVLASGDAAFFAPNTKAS